MRENRGASYMDTYDKDYEERKYSGFAKKKLQLNLCALCSKWILFIVNMLLLLFGAAVLIIAIYIKQNPGNIDTTVNFGGIGDDIFYLAIAIAILLIILALLGCGGAYTNSRCLLLSYILLLIIILIFEIIIISLIFEQSYLKAYLRGQWDNLDCADRLIVEQKYCCCEFEDANANEDSCNCPSNVNSNGTCNDYTGNTCYKSVLNAFSSQINVIAFITIAAGLYEIFMLIMSILLCVGQRKQRNMNDPVVV